MSHATNISWGSWGETTGEYIAPPPPRPICAGGFGFREIVGCRPIVLRLMEFVISASFNLEVRPTCAVHKVCPPTNSALVGKRKLFASEKGRLPGQAGGGPCYARVGTTAWARGDQLDEARGRFSRRGPSSMTRFPT